MQKARTFLILGIWVAILPYLGFPFTIKNILFVITGFVLIYFSLLFYKQAMRQKEKKAQNFDNFSENNPEKRLN
ncbi:MAG: hypothetical protein NTW98_00330 [Candidatus Nomurabacteria bacterium]|nr:hypothetical protein [Candidatus Nomurabacteria bacterium]